MQKRISQFLHKKYLLTIACCEQDTPWANALYYVFDEAHERLIYVTGEQTHHAKVMLNNPRVAGTIFTPTRFYPSLQGVQFTGSAKMLKGKDATYARNLYKTQYKHELIDQLSVWAIELEFVRLLDHSLGLFGKIDWRKGDPEEEELESLFNA